MILPEEKGYSGSNISKIESVNLAGNIEINPNPAEGKIISLSTEGLASGRYRVQVFNTASQLMEEKFFTQGFGKSIWKMPVSSSLSGIYALLISSDNGKIKKLNVVIK